MEEKKLDINSIIGFLLIFGILIFWFYTKQPTPEEIEAQKTEQQQAEQTPDADQVPDKTPVLQESSVDLNDSIAVADYKKKIGDSVLHKLPKG